MHREGHLLQTLANATVTAKGVEETKSKLVKIPLKVSEKRLDILSLSDSEISTAKKKLVSGFSPIFPETATFLFSLYAVHIRFCEKWLTSELGWPVFKSSVDLGASSIR